MKHHTSKTILLIFCLFLSFSVKCVGNAQETHCYAEQLLRWKGSLFTGDTNAVYRIDPGKTWECITDFGFRGVFFAEGDTVYFAASDHGNTAIISYHTLTKQTETLFHSKANAYLLGKRGDHLYYLEQEQGREPYEGKILKSYHLLSGETKKIADNIGKGVYWNGTFLLCGMATDIRPVWIGILNDKDQIQILDAYCNSNFVVSDEGVFYWTYQMQDEMTWDGTTLVLFTESQKKDVIRLEGKYLTISSLGKIRNVFYASYWEEKNSRTVTISIDLETGLYSQTILPEENSTFEIFCDGEIWYWYSLATHSLYLAQYSEKSDEMSYLFLCTLPPKVILYGIYNDTVYFCQYDIPNVRTLCTIDLQD